MIKILYEDRKIIEEMYNSQMPINRIADRINVARSTLYRELRRGWGDRAIRFVFC